MKTVKYIAVIICALVCLAIAAPFFQQRTPEAYVRAKNLAIEMEPTATAAAIRNQEAAIHATIVAPAQATAEAASILANNRQRIDEDAHQQALRHTGEMAALTISNTQRLSQIDADYTAKVEGIKASGAKAAAEANADAARASAGAWRDTITYGGIAIGAVVLLVGAALAIVAWLSTRAKIINDPITGPILVTGRGVVMLGNVTTPVLAWNPKEPIRIAGESERPLVAQRQAFALIGKAAQSGNPEMARVAQHAATSAMQQSWTQNNAVLDSAVHALPAAHGDLAGRVPTFAEFLRTWRPTVEQMLYAFDEQGRPIFGSIDQLLSGLVIGRQNQGKTTLLRILGVQCEMIGAKVIAWDIHDDIAEDMPWIVSYSRARDIERSAQEMHDELERRITLKLKRDKAQPIMVLVDEVNEIVEQVPTLPKIIKRIVSEGRKYRTFEFVTAKGAPAGIFETSWARDSFSALFAFWTSALQARNAGFEKDEARLAETLTPGRAVLRLQTMPAQVVTFPDLPLEDLRRLLPASGATSRAASEPLPVWSSSTSEKAEKSGKSGENERPEADYFEGVEDAGRVETVRQLLKQGKSQREIIFEVWHATGGNDYKVAAQELNTIIRGLVQ